MWKIFPYEVTTKENEKYGERRDKGMAIGELTEIIVLLVLSYVEQREQRGCYSRFCMNL